MRAFAELSLIIILAAFLLLHVAVILRVIPYGMVWGGRLKSAKKMYQFEAVSILLNSIFLSIALAVANYIQLPVGTSVLRIMLWVMAGLFLLNTLGNSASKNRFEQCFFAPLTAILAILSGYLALIL